MAYRKEEKQRMAAVLNEVGRRLEVFRKEFGAYQKVEQDLERNISDLQSLLTISRPVASDPPLLKKLKQDIHSKARELEASLGESMERLSEHQRMEPNVVPSFRKEVGLLMENLPIMDEFNPLVISGLDPGHSLTRYIVVKRPGRTHIRRGSGNPTQIIQDSTGRYSPAWKQWEERSMAQFFESDIAGAERIEMALEALLGFYGEHTKDLKPEGK